MAPLNPNRPLSLLAQHATDIAQAFATNEHVDLDDLNHVCDSMQRCAMQARRADDAWQDAAHVLIQLRNPSMWTEGADREAFAQAVFKATTHALWASDKHYQQ